MIKGRLEINANKIGVIYATIPVTIKDQTMSGSDMNSPQDYTDTENLAHLPPPLKQIQNGVKPSQVTCAEGLELVLKRSNGQPACIKPGSVEKLVARGWASQ